MSERRLLQLVVAVASLVPISAGAAGMWLGLDFVGGAAGATDADSHFRYLSGLLLAIGIAFLATVPRIETRTARFRLLAAIVVTGGLGRLVGLILRGPPHAPMLFGLGMELVVTPALAIWQGRVARRTT